MDATIAEFRFTLVVGPLPRSAGADDFSPTTWFSEEFLAGLAGAGLADPHIAPRFRSARLTVRARAHDRAAAVASAVEGLRRLGYSAWVD